MVTANYEDFDEPVGIDAVVPDDEFLDSEFDEAMDEGLSLCGHDDWDLGMENGKGCVDKQTFDGVEGIVERIVEITFEVEKRSESDRTTDDWPIDWDPSE